MKVLERVISPTNSDLELRNEIAIARKTKDTFAFRTAQCEDAVREDWEHLRHHFLGPFRPFQVGLLVEPKWA